jgi:hypothetical protein
VTKNPVTSPLEAVQAVVNQTASLGTTNPVVANLRALTNPRVVANPPEKSHQGAANPAVGRNLQEVENPVAVTSLQVKNLLARNRLERSPLVKNLLARSLRAANPTRAAPCPQKAAAVVAGPKAAAVPALALHWSNPADKAVCQAINQVQPNVRARVHSPVKRGLAQAGAAPALIWGAS